MSGQVGGRVDLDHYLDSRFMSKIPGNNVDVDCPVHEKMDLDLQTIVYYSTTFTLSSVLFFLLRLKDFGFSIDVGLC